MKTIRIILIGLFLLTSFAFSIQNKDFVGEWRISEDNIQRLNYPRIILESDSVVTLFNNLDTLDKGKFCTCDGGLSLNLSEVLERIDIVHHSKDTMILSGFSHNLVLENYKFNDTVTYIRFNPDKDESKNKVNRFNDFLQKFEVVKLPITFDETILRTNSLPSNPKVLDSNSIKEFIEIDINLMGNEEDLTHFKYYAVYRFNTNNDLKCIIYKVIGGAGGFNDSYFINLYSNDGKKLNSLKVAELNADCGFKNIITSNINLNQIERVGKEFEINCDDESEKLISEVTQSYYLDSELNEIKNNEK